MDAVPLGTPQKANRITADESAQLKRVLDLLHRRFAEPIRMRDLCAVGNISERSLYRLLVRHMGENMTDYLSRLRIGRACMWLGDRSTDLRHRGGRQLFQYYIKHGSMPGLDEFGLTKRSPSLERPKRRSRADGAANAGVSSRINPITVRPRNIRTWGEHRARLVASSTSVSPAVAQQR